MKELLDCFNKDPFILKQKKLFLFDLDGTIYNEGVLFDGALELFDFLKSDNRSFSFMTNNSSKSVIDYEKKLKSIGLDVTIDNFCTSSQVAADYLKKNYNDKCIYCQGTRSLVAELKQSDLNVIESYSLEAQVVLVGFDTELTSKKLYNTCRLVTEGLPFFATNMDLVCPVSFGFIPDCGSICLMIENATNSKPIYFGKPSHYIIDYALNKYGYSLEETVIIGDRLYTDIATGVNAKIDSICVLTGESDMKSITESRIKPTYIMNSVKDLYYLLANIG